MKKFSVHAYFFLLILIIHLKQDASANESFESIPQFNIANIIDNDLISSKLHSVDPVVKSDGYMNLYILNTKFGNYNVKGTYFLYKRIRELEALDFIEKNFSTKDVVYESTKTAATDLVVSPIKATKKVLTTVSDKDKLATTAKKIPGGITNLFKFAANAVSDVTGSAIDAGNRMLNESSADESSSNSLASSFEETTNFISEKTLDYIGYNSNYRKLCKSMKVDPYTGNEILRNELRRISGLQSAISTGSKFVPGFSIPGITEAHKYLNYAEKTAMYDDPKKVEKLNKQKLDILSKTEAYKTKNENTANNAFLENPHYSPIMRSEIINALDTLSKAKVKNLNDLITMSSKTSSRESSQFYVFGINKLADLSQEYKLKFIVKDSIIPIGVGADGTAILPLAIDNIFWTSETSSYFKNFIEKISKKHSVSKLKVLISGNASYRFKEEIQKLIRSQIITNIKF